MSRFSRLMYRAGQLKGALTGQETPLPEEGLRLHLSPTQILLFQQMQPFEQGHAWRLCMRLKQAGYHDPDLLTAALLHDVGKVRFPLNPLARVWIVVATRLCPRAAMRWGKGEARGPRLPFVVAAQHPAWGAEMAAESGASARACALIQHHQDKGSADDPLLAALQRMDDES